MVDARQQFKEILENISFDGTFTVAMKFPQSTADGEMVTYYELTNTQTANPVVDDIAFMVDVWAYDTETLVSLSVAVSDAVCAVGFRRQFSSPDMTPEEENGYFRKTMRFGRKVDTRTNRLID